MKKFLAIGAMVLGLGACANPVIQRNGPVQDGSLVCTVYNETGKVFETGYEEAYRFNQDNSGHWYICVG